MSSTADLNRGSYNRCATLFDIEHWKKRPQKQIKEYKILLKFQKHTIEVNIIILSNPLSICGILDITFRVKQDVEWIEVNNLG